ncbi:hypothetical protein HMPREF0658_0728 [Hoylesella marshii DSM 16973 = JCM 13450]|uniref:Uncharacterized protein n=1 Tax=Hoylesella marshii DSM 16973 = JCM 13450 TaxID=862515 RepID=E0NRC7_9BACT|nr:hypothetical protein HMPREF0658_0728 [Hoylesella marshii DSM 16973 = JCM 13450]
MNFQLQKYTFFTSFQRKSYQITRTSLIGITPSNGFSNRFISYFRLNFAK